MTTKNASLHAKCQFSYSIWKEVLTLLTILVATKASKFSWRGSTASFSVEDSVGLGVVGFKRGLIKPPYIHKKKHVVNLVRCRISINLTKLSWFLGFGQPKVVRLQQQELRSCPWLLLEPLLLLGLGLRPCWPCPPTPRGSTPATSKISSSQVGTLSSMLLFPRPSESIQYSYV